MPRYLVEEVCVRRGDDKSTDFRFWHLGDVGVSPNVRFAPTAEVCPSTVMEGERFPRSAKVSQIWTHPVGQISDLALDGARLVGYLT
jgi:hypothetical protein